MVTNVDRAEWAAEALEVFTENVFHSEDIDEMDPEDLQCAVGDLICDLLHFARRREMNTDEIISNAVGNFQEETGFGDDYDE